MLAVEVYPSESVVRGLSEGQSFLHRGSWLKSSTWESDTCFSWYLSCPQWLGVALQPFPNFVAGAPASRHSLRDENKPAGSRARLSSPVDAIELTLTCLAKECGVGLLICLALESRRLQSFPLVICSASRACVILHNWCFRSTKNTSCGACRNSLSLTNCLNIFWMEAHLCF